MAVKQPLILGPGGRAKVASLKEPLRRIVRQGNLPVAWIDGHASSPVVFNLVGPGVGVAPTHERPSHNPPGNANSYVVTYPVSRLSFDDGGDRPEPYRK